MGATVLVSAAAGLFSLWFSRLPDIIERSGEQAARHGDAVQRIPLWTVVSAVTARCAWLLVPLVPQHLRRSLDRSLLRAGYPLGLSAEEVIVSGILCGLIGAIAGGLLAGRAVGAAVPGVLIGLLLCACAPVFKVQDAAIERVRALLRQLPAALEMIALCLQAGMDFNGALSNVASRMPAAHPLRFEFEHILHCLALGRSRAEALEEMARRVRSGEVERFAAGVILAGRKGAPLAETLSIQADVMRTRRSQAAEQAAARASLLMLGPLMLIFASVFVLLLGPFIIKALKGELV